MHSGCSWRQLSLELLSFPVFPSTRASPNSFLLSCMKYAAEMWNKIESEQSSLCAVESVNPDLPYFLGKCPFTLRSASCSTFKFINCQPQVNGTVEKRPEKGGKGATWAYNKLKLSSPDTPMTSTHVCVSAYNQLHPSAPILTHTHTQLGLDKLLLYAVSVISQRGSKMKQ